MNKPRRIKVKQPEEFRELDWVVPEELLVLDSTYYGEAARLYPIGIGPTVFYVWVWNGPARADYYGIRVHFTNGAVYDYFPASNTAEINYGGLSHLEHPEVTLPAFYTWASRLWPRLLEKNPRMVQAWNSVGETTTATPTRNG